MNVGKWIGKVVGQWFGAVEELPPGFTSGVASIYIGATGSINDDSGLSFISGSSSISINVIGSLVQEQPLSGGALMAFRQMAWKAEQQKEAKRKQQRKIEQEQAEELARLERIEAERLAEEEEAERQYVDLVARLSVVEPEELANKIELAPDAIEQLASIRDAAAQGVRLALNEHAKNSPISIQVSDDTLQNAAFLNDDEAMALIMILAEID